MFLVAIKQESRKRFRFFTFVILMITLLLSSGCGGKSVEYDDQNYPAIGRTIVFLTPMIYARNLGKRFRDTESMKFNRLLLREGDHVFSGTEFESGKNEIQRIKENMRFEVVRSFKVIPWGLQTRFSDEYRVLVIRDQNGVLYTIVELIIDEDEFVS